jgi:hypothetical protein
MLGPRVERYVDVTIYACRRLSKQLLACQHMRVQLFLQPNSCFLALDIPFEGYGASINPRAQPSIDADYVSRISSRLNSAAVTDKRFRSPLIVPCDSDCLRLSHGRAHRKRCRQL